jgi:hypothetical protein
MLSRSSKQTLLTLVTHQLKELNVEAKCMKRACAFWYQAATPENPHGFAMLNISRGYLRDAKAEIKKLAALSKELKDRLASTSSNRVHGKAPKVVILPTAGSYVSEIQKISRSNREPGNVKIYPMGDDFNLKPGVWGQDPGDDEPLSYCGHTFPNLREHKSALTGPGGTSDIKIEAKGLSEDRLNQAIRQWVEMRKAGKV